MDPRPCLLTGYGDRLVANRRERSGDTRLRAKVMAAGSCWFSGFSEEGGASVGSVKAFTSSSCSESGSSESYHNVVGMIKYLFWGAWLIDLEY